jgi:Uncharacterized conserved protein
MNTIKHLSLTGISEVSWDDAINCIILKTAETVDNITSIEIISKSANINNNKISHYIVDVDLSFVVENKN